MNTKLRSVTLTEKIAFTNVTCGAKGNNYSNLSSAGRNNTHIQINSYMQTGNRKSTSVVKILSLVLVIMGFFVVGASAQEARSITHGTGKTTTLVPQQNADKTWGYIIKVNNAPVYSSATMPGSKSGYPNAGQLNKVLTAVETKLRLQSRSPLDMTAAELKAFIIKAENSVQPL